MIEGVLIFLMGVAVGALLIKFIIERSSGVWLQFG